MDIGYNLTSSPQALREGLAAVGRGSRNYNLLPLQEPEVARLLVTMGNSINHHAIGSAEAPSHAANPATAVGPLFDSFAAAANRPPVFASGRAHQHTSGPGENWRHDVVAMVLREDASHLDWSRVVACLDYADCNLSSAAAFNFVVVIVHACNSGFPVVELLRKPWSNARAQVDALRHAINAPPEYINFSYGVSSPDRLMSRVTGSSAGTGSPNNAWCCVDVYAMLLRQAIAGGQEVAALVDSILSGAQSIVPELVLLGVARTKVDEGIDSDPSGQDPNPSRAKVYNTILTTAFGNLILSQSRVQPTPLQQGMLARLWETSPSLAVTSLLALVRAIANRVQGDEAAQLRVSMEGVARVVTMVQQLPDFATALLSAPAPQLTVEVAAFLSAPPVELEQRIASEPVPAAWQGADGTGGFKLEAWLAVCLAPQNAAAADRFATACLSFLKRVLGAHGALLQKARPERGAPADGVAGPPELVAAAQQAASTGAQTTAEINAVLSALQAEQSAQEAVAKESPVREETVGKYARALRTAASSGALPPATSTAIAAMLEACMRAFPSLQSFASHEVEDSANALFQQVYKNVLSIPDVMELMRRYKNSSHAKERDIFNCMVRNLFDEYKYFAQYPDAELRLTGVLFGQLIAHQLVSSTTLGVALRYVLEALRKPPTTPASAKMYRFGMFALEQFKGRLPKWPQYCSHITSIPHLRAQHPEFVAELESAVAAAARAGGAGMPDGAMGSGVSLVGNEPVLAGMDAAVSASGAGAPVGVLDGATPLPGAHRQSSLFAGTFASEGAGAVSREPAATAPPQPLKPTDLRGRLAALGADLTVALAAASSGQPIPAILPSAAAQAAAAKEAEEKAAAAAVLSAGGSSSEGGRAGGSGASGSGDAHGAADRAVEPPPPQLQEKFSMLLNNLTDTNTDTRSNEFNGLLKVEHIPWVSTVVVKRAATQANFQSSMRLLLEKLGNKDLDREVLRTTLDNVRKLLAADKERSRAGGASSAPGGTSSERQERTMLKNLGSWLGRITLSRNRPVLYKDLNVKEVLHEAYETGRLISVVAFVAKLMEGAAESAVFRPPNPWTMAVLCALRELYDVTDLKLNLKFEVEVLAKALNVELKDIRPSRLLPNRRRPDLRSNLDFNQKAAQAPELIPGVAPRDAAAGTAGTSTAAPGGTPAIPGLLSITTLKAFAPVFHSSVSEAEADSEAADPGAEADEPGGPKAALRNVVAVALDRAVRELIQPVVERSVTIAVITTRELVLKDFAAEPDADKLAKAAHVLASDLAGSLAVITCTEPVKASLGNHLRSLLTSHQSVITNLPVSLAVLGDAGLNTMLTGVVAENTEVASMLVEKAAMERAVRAVDEALTSHYAARRRAAETGSAFVDTAAYTAGSKWHALLPEYLRHRPGATGLSAAQLRVYDGFSRGSTAATEAGAAAATAAGAAAGPASAAEEGKPGLTAVATGAAAGAAAAASPEALAAFSAGTAGQAAAPLTDAGGSAANAPVTGGPALPPGQANQEYNSALERLTGGIRTTAAQIAQTSGPTAAAVTAATLANLSPETELLASLRDIRAIGMRVSPGEAREQVCLLQAQKLLKGLLELPPSPVSVLDALAGQVYVAALGVLKELTRQLRRDMVVYLTRVSEERLYACDGVIASLTRAGLLYVPDLDHVLHKAAMPAADPRAAPSAGAAGLQFVLRVLARIIVQDRTVSPMELPTVMEALVALAQRYSAAGHSTAAAGTLPASLNLLLDNIKAVAASGGFASTSRGSASTANTAVPLVLPTAVAAVQGPSLLIGPPQALPNGSSMAAAAVAAAQSSEGYTEDVRQRVLYLLETWVRLCAEAAVGAVTDKHYSQYVSVLVQQGVLTNDASTERFFRIMMDLCVQSCAATAKAYTEDKVVPTSVLAAPTTNMATAPVPTPKMKLSYTGVDALSKLVVLLLKVAGDHPAKVALLQKLIVIFARTLIRDADANGGGCTTELAAGGAPAADARFDPRPYLRLFCNLLRDLHMNVPSPAPGSETTPEREKEIADTISFNAQVLATFANVFHLTQPARVPGFAFAWLELVSHRLFLPPLLAVPAQRGWPLVHRLIVDILRFLYPFTRRAELNEGLRLLHKGTLRMLLVLYHDCPEFLADYMWTLLEVLPVHATQARNTISAAVPRAIRTPELPAAPSASGATVAPMMETLVESSLVPRVLGSPAETLPSAITNQMEAYYRTVSAGPSPARSVAASALGPIVRAALFADADESLVVMGRYSTRVLSAFVQHALALACSRLVSETPGVEQNPTRIPIQAISVAGSSGPIVDLFKSVLASSGTDGGMDAEGRYNVIHTLVAQLRFPSAHTLLVTRMLLSLYGDEKDARDTTVSPVREILVRVLVERLIAHRPHPWAVLVLFVELLRVPSYNLAAQPFLHSSAEVERLFETVARSCLGGQTPLGWTPTQTS